MKKLEAAVEKARRQEEWRVEYMTLLMRDREKFAEGKAEGKAESDALWLEALTPLIKKDNAVAEAVAASMGITVEKLMQLIL